MPVATNACPALNNRAHDTTVSRYHGATVIQVSARMSVPAVYSLNTHGSVAQMPESASGLVAHGDATRATSGLLGLIARRHGVGPALPASVAGLRRSASGAL
jgi:hypothetical protein